MSTLIGTVAWLKRRLFVNYNHNKANNHLEHVENPPTRTLFHPGLFLQMKSANGFEKGKPQTQVPHRSRLWLVLYWTANQVRRRPLSVSSDLTDQLSDVQVSTDDEVSSIHS